MGYIITTTNGELYHHGVKGMKWGVRKNPDTISRKIAKLDSRTDKYEQKIHKAESKVEKYKRNTPSRYFTVFGKRKARKNIMRAMATEGQILKLKDKIAKNEHIKEALNKRLSDISQSTIDSGKAFADSILREEK